MDDDRCNYIYFNFILFLKTILFWKGKNCSEIPYCSEMPINNMCLNSDYCIYSSFSKNNEEGEGKCVIDDCIKYKKIEFFNYINCTYAEGICKY
jgi:hypothetical protein